MLWKDFFPLILPEVADCPEPVVEAHLRRTAIEFANDTAVWTADADPISVVAGQGTYDLDSPETDSVVCGVSELWYAGKRIKFIPLAQMRRYGTHWPSDKGEVVGFTQRTENTVTLYKTPTAALANAINATVILRPSPTAAGVPDWLGQKYMDTLVAGAKARLMAMVGMPWSHAQGATLYGGIYNGDSLSVASARATSRARGQLSSPLGGGEE